MAWNKCIKRCLVIIFTSIIVANVIIMNRSGLLNEISTDIPNSGNGILLDDIKNLNFVHKDIYVRDQEKNPFPEKLRLNYKNSGINHSIGPLDWQHFHPRPSEHLDIKRIKMEAREKYAERRRPIEEYCRKIERDEDHKSMLYRKTHELPNMYMTHSPDHRFLGCARLKSGFSSWKSMYKAIIKYYNYPVNCDEIRCDHLYEEFFKLPRNPELIRQELASDSLTFLFTRNPFTHVVSAYNYLFTGMSNERKIVMNEYQDEIQKINEARSSKGLPTRAVPPSIWVQRILDRSENALLWDLNEHYKPSWFYCSICGIEYDVIGRIETFDEDVSFILDKLELRDAIKSPAHENTPPRKTSVEEFYSQVSKKQVWQLQDLYKHDLIMEGFNDTVSTFLSLAKD